MSELTYEEAVEICKVKDASKLIEDYGAIGFIDKIIPLGLQNRLGHIHNGISKYNNIGRARGAVTMSWQVYEILKDAKYMNNMTFEREYFLEILSKVYPLNISNGGVNLYGIKEHDYATGHVNSVVIMMFYQMLTTYTDNLDIGLGGILLNGRSFDFSGREYIQ